MAGMALRALGWLWWRAWTGLVVAGDAAALCVAGVALGDTPPEPAQCLKYHTCHAKRRWMSPSARLAMQNEGGCH